MVSNLNNPKRSEDSLIDKSSYYAGFSEKFVQSVFDTLKLSKNSRVLDPWNGSGTTTRVASKNGFSSFGIDINPLMKHVASSSFFKLKDQKSELLFLELVRKAILDSNISTYNSEDPLLPYFDEKSCSVIRGINFSFKEISKSRKLKLNKNEYCYSFLVNCLVISLKNVKTKLKGSNPTWTKKPTNKSDRIKLDDEVFKSELIKVISTQLVKNQSVNFEVTPKIEVGSSLKLNFRNKYFDLVLTSPPYCTRIDYIMATLLELLVIETDSSEIKTLRNNSLGTPTIFLSLDDLMLEKILSKKCRILLKSISKHSSYASSRYYIKFYYQYFLNLQHSLAELARVLKSDGHIFLVVQDSYYKELLIPLHEIIIEMMEVFGLQNKVVKSFKVTNNFIYINSKSKKYRAFSNQEEHVVVFGGTSVKKKQKNNSTKSRS